MKRFILGIAFVALIATAALFENRAVGQTADPHKALLTTYCVTCHNTRLKTGGLALDSANLQSPADDAHVWELALRKLRGHQMPPPGAPQPPQKDVDAFTSWMETTLDTHPKGQKAGYVPIQRLNRTEYVASVKALLDVDLAKDILPQDLQVDGFDNIAAALSVSPSFLDQYVTAARQIAKLAVGNPSGKVFDVKYSVAANQNPDVPLPLGTRGGIKFKHNFPADGEYRITMNDLSVGQYTGSMENESTVILMIDGRIVFRKPIGGRADLAVADRKAGAARAQIMERFTKIPVQVKAGTRDVVVAFIDRSHVESDENFQNPLGFGGLTGGTAVLNRLPQLLAGVEVTGPFNATGVSKTPSRALVFVCDPKQKEEASCARQITENLARRAFRHPVSADDVNRLIPFYEAGRKNGGSFDQGVEQMVAAVLASPEFLYRSIRGNAARASQTGEYALTDLELASRLSYFLWNSGPDEQLLALAASGGLTKPGAAEAQVKRMLADPKASSLVTSFAMKWLTLDQLDSVKPDPALFPGFTEPLRHDFAYEAEAFISSIFLEDRPVMDLLTSNTTFLNERLARHYGINDVTGPQFRKVTLTEKERAGLLGKAAVLMRTSYADRTSPVLRGAWVLDKLLGTPPTPPPPDTATDLSQKVGEQPKTVRARLEQHRNKATCKMCHGVIDPTGLALENFDAIGAWRTVDRQANAPIDASTVLPSGVSIDGPVDLRAQLADHPQTFMRAFTEKLMMYALNRQLESYDMPQVRAVVRGAAKDNYKLSSLILGIVNTDAFRKQGPAPRGE